MSGKFKKSSFSRNKRRLVHACVLLLVVLIVSCVHHSKRTSRDSSPEPVRVCSVIRVYDGDTLWVRCNGQREKLRLYCIDAPEIGQKPWGERSRDHLSSLLGRQLLVESRGTDKYGRTVARIRDGAVDVGARMVLDGFAVVYPKYCPSTERDYYRHENHAKQRRLEVWSGPGLQSKPWVWRH